MLKFIFAVAFLIFCYGFLSAQNIHQMTADGKSDSVQWLIRENPDLTNSKNTDGKTPLIIALEKGRDSIAEFLLKSGADINLGTNFKTMPLHFAAFYNRLAILKILLAKGADIKAQNQQGFTALHFAAWGGHKEICSLLLEKGAWLEATDIQKRTPLLMATQSGLSGPTELLIEKGANLRAADLNGSTVFHHAAENGLTKTIEPFLTDEKAILTKDHFGRTPLYLAMAGGYKDIVYPVLTKIKPQSDYKTAEGNTYLHAAAFGGLDSVAALLIQNGSDVNVKNVFGFTPLHIASNQSSVAMLELLLKSGADVNMKTPSGKAAWHIAKEKGNTDIRNLFIANKADTSDFTFTRMKGDFLGIRLPGKTPFLFAPGIVSTPDFNERDVAWNISQTEFHFTRWPMNRLWNIMSMCQEKFSWTAPEPVSFSKNYLFAEACFSPDDGRLYFISNRPLSGTGPAAAWEMWYCNRADTGWSSPRWMGKDFTGCFYPSFTNHGLMIFTDNNNDLFSAELKDGRFSDIQKFGDSVNTPQAEFNACIAPDGSYMIMTSYGWGEGYGSDDLYVTFRKKDGSWTTPENMGPGINTFAKEYCPSVSRDGKFLFFSSSRYGTEDIFWVSTKIIDEMKK